MAQYNRTKLTPLFEVSHIVEITYRGIPADSVIDRKSKKNFWCLYYIDRGSVSFFMESGEQTVLTSGKGIFFAPMETFDRTESGAGGACVLSVFFACEALDRTAFHLLQRSFDTSERMLLSELTMLGNTWFVRYSVLPEGPKGTRPREGAPDYVPHMVKATLEFLLLRLYKTRDESPAAAKASPEQTGLTVNAAMEFMYRNVDKKLKVEDIAAAVKMSRSHFQTVFRKATGQSVMSCFNSLKIRQAKIMLRKGVHTSAEIAAALGYSSESYFSRQFKQHTDMTPTEYTRLVWYG